MTARPNCATSQHSRASRNSWQPLRSCQLRLHAAAGHALELALTAELAFGAASFCLCFARRAFWLARTTDAMDAGNGERQASAQTALARVAHGQVFNADLPDYVAHKGYPAATSFDHSFSAGLATDRQGLAAAGLGGGAAGAVGTVRPAALPIARAGLGQLYFGKAAPSARNRHAVEVAIADVVYSLRITRFFSLAGRCTAGSGWARTARKALAALTAIFWIAAGVLPKGRSANRGLGVRVAPQALSPASKLTALAGSNWRALAGAGDALQGGHVAWKAVPEIRARRADSRLRLA